MWTDSDYCLHLLNVFFCCEDILKQHAKKLLEAQKKTYVGSVPLYFM